MLRPSRDGDLERRGEAAERGDVYRYFPLEIKKPRPEQAGDHPALANMIRGGRWAVGQGGGCLMRPRFRQGKNLVLIRVLLAQAAADGYSIEQRLASGARAG